MLHTAWGAAHHLRGLIPVNPWTPPVVLVGLLLVGLTWRRLAAGLGWRPRATALALLSLVGVLALTLTPKDWEGNHRSLAQCVPADAAGWAQAAAGVGHGLESLLNIAMLVPLGFFLVWASRRVVWPAALLVTMPAAIELAQVVVPGRGGSPKDWFGNALGGLLGMAAAAATGALARRRAGDRPADDQRAALTRS